MRSNSRSKTQTRAYFLLVLLILPMLPEKSEQYGTREFHSKFGSQTPWRGKVYQLKPIPSKPGRIGPTRTHAGSVNQVPIYVDGTSPVVTPHRTVTPPKFQWNQITPNRKDKKVCKGRKNILDDIGILSLITAMTSSTFGFYTILVNSMTSNNIGLVSSFLSIVIWLPSVLLSLSQKTGEFITFIGHFMNGLSFVNSLYGLIGVVYGTADVLASVAGETIGIISLILSVIATFPDYLDEIIEYIYRTAGRKNRRRLKYYIENYGCSEDVPGVFTLAGRPFYEIVNMFLVDKTKQKGYRKPNEN